MNEDCWYKKVCNQECTSNCIRYLEMKYLMDNSNIPKSRQTPISLFCEDIDYEAYCLLADVKNTVESFVNTGRSLYITSEYTGNGKTSWAIKILLKYFDSIWAGNGFRVRGVFVHVPTFLTKLKQFDSKDESFEQLKQNLLTADLVVWDDIAANGMSAYDHTQLLTYIDQRALENKSNIFTGNLHKNQLEKAIGTRLASRVWNASTVVELFGKDRRCEHDTITDIK